MSMTARFVQVTPDLLAHLLRSPSSVTELLAPDEDAQIAPVALTDSMRQDWLRQMPQLLAVRGHIAANVKRLRTIVESPAFRRQVGQLEGERLQRVPRGFPKDHDAAEFLKFRQFLAGREFPPALATSPGFYRTLITVFRRVAPLARFLNEPLLG